jgi:Integrase core domain
VTRLGEPDPAPAGTQPARRGSTHQHPRRGREQAARRHAAQTARRLVDRGRHWSEVARLFHLSIRTLQRWREPDPTFGSLRLRGRPVLHSPREARNELLHFLDEYGPGVGVPTLRACFPDMMRAEQADLLRRYRRVWRERHRLPLRVLHWSEPGRVWAIDFAEAPAPVDGRFPYLLAVRDLASGMTLLWQPVEHATATNAAALLAGLFATHGAPLVLKSDNGSAFGEASVQELLRMWNVAHLFSPPHWPRYNGAVEAGIGALKARTEAHAARRGHAGHWTWDDVGGVMLETNTLSRPRGENEPSPLALWTARSAISADERDGFADCVRHRLDEAKPEPSSCGASEPDVWSNRRLARVAIRLALEECGCLTYTRRRIPPPIPRRKTDSIP